MWSDTPAAFGRGGQTAAAVGATAAVVGNLSYNQLVEKVIERTKKEKDGNSMAELMMENSTKI